MGTYRQWSRKASPIALVPGQPGKQGASDALYSPICPAAPACKGMRGGGVHQRCLTFSEQQLGTVGSCPEVGSYTKAIGAVVTYSNEPGSETPTVPTKKTKILLTEEPTGSGQVSHLYFSDSPHYLSSSLSPRCGHYCCHHAWPPRTPYLGALSWPSCG